MHENNLKEYFYKQLKKKTLEDLCLNKVSYNKLDKILRSDKDIALEAIKHERFVYYDVPNNLKKNREIILASVKKYGLILEFVPNKFKNDKEIVLQAVKIVVSHLNMLQKT